MQRHGTELAPVSLGHLTEGQRRALPAVFGSFLDAAVTATARATYYNTREEQERAVLAAHEALFAVDRGIYAATLLLPGATDYARQLGVRRLLSIVRDGEAVLSLDLESEVLRRLVTGLPPQRMLKLFGQLREARVNNARTRKLILRSLLGGGLSEHRAVKYRRKLACALEHAWGKKTAGILRSILEKSGAALSEKERRIVQRHLRRYVEREEDRNDIEQCVRFVLGAERDLTLPRLRAYTDAKRDFPSGHVLPYEVLEGIRSRYHRDRTSAEVLELTRKQLTAGQRMGLQRKAREADVQVRLDLSRYDAVRLYLYAFEMGMSSDIRRQLAIKARQAAERLPVRFGRVAVLLDGSASMRGHETQKRRPIAVALAVRDLLCAAADEAIVSTGDGRPAPVHGLVETRGDTSLAAGLVALLRRDPEAIFMVTDGYENAPSRRTDEVVHAVRRLGISTPIFQLSPVFARETGAVRLLSAEVPTLPVSNTEGIGIGLLKAAFEIDLERGVAALLGMTLPALVTPGSVTKEIEADA